MALYSETCKETGTADYDVSLEDKENHYLQGNAVDGKDVYPFSAILVAVWDTFAVIKNVPKKELSIEFRDILLQEQPMLNDQTQLKFRVQIQNGAGNFEVLNEGVILASGCITEKSYDSKETDTEVTYATEEMDLTAADIYDLLEERGYTHSEEFRNIERASTSLDVAELVWRDNWVTFIDSILQLNALKQPSTAISSLTQIKIIYIDVKKHNEIIKAAEEKNVLRAHISEEFNHSRCGGILIEDVRFKKLPAITNNKVDFQALKFIQNEQTDIDITTSLMIFLQTVAENINKEVVKIVGLTNNHSQATVFDILPNIGSNVYDVNIQYEQLDLKDCTKNRTILQEADVVVVYNLSADNDVCQQLHHVYESQKFVISEEDKILGDRIRPSSLYKVVSTLSGDRNACSRLQLIRWRPTPSPPIGTAITVRTSYDFSLLKSARAALPSRSRLLIFTSYPAPPGLKELVKVWRRETDRNTIQLVMVNNEGNNIFVDELPDIDLTFSIIDQCKWGGEYYVPVGNTSVSQISFNPKLVQLAQFNDETVGLQFIGRLVDRGAKKIQIHYESVLTAKSQLKIRLWQNMGVQFQISSHSLSTRTDAENLIKNAKSLGNVQGIFSLITSEENIQESLFTSLDLASRKLCPNLSYFAVINIGEMTHGHSTCISRARGKLPATMLCLSELGSGSKRGWIETLDAIEHGLSASENVVFARAVPEQNSTLTHIKSPTTVKSEDIRK